MDLSTSSELHRYAEALLVHLAADGSAPALPPGTTDVPDCWLAPAIQALVLLMSGEEAIEPLSRAAELDEERTALFLCLALAVSGHGDRIHASWLGTAFGELSPDQPVTPGQRALWLAAARGAYGPAGKIFVLRKLDSVAVPPQDELWLKALVPSEPPVVVPPSLVDFPDLAAIPELATPALAAERLTRLLHRCTEITAPHVPPTAVVSRPARAVTQNTANGSLRTTPTAQTPTPPGTAGSPASQNPPNGSPSTTPTAQNPTSPGTVGPPASQNPPPPGTGEPTAAQNPTGLSADVWPDAEPLAVLRALIGQTDTAAEGPLSSLSGHLLEDVRPGADRHLAAIALHVAAPAVRAAAEHLAEVTAAKPPESVTVPIHGHAIRLRPDGPDAESMKAAEEHIAMAAVPARGSFLVAYALLIVGVVLLGTGVVLSPLVCLTGLAVGAWGGRRMLQERTRQHAHHDHVTSQVGELREMADHAVWALHEYAREASRRAEQAEAELAEITRLLRRGPRAA